MATRKKAAKKATNKETPATKKAPPAMDQEAMMAAWQKAMNPSDGHRRLDPLVGSFRAKTTFTMMPGAPPDLSEATSEHRWVLGGRYLEQVYKGTSMGMPFEGRGYTAYDNVQKKYLGVWMDTFGTGLMTSVGVGKPTDREIRMDSEAIDPSGAKVHFDAIIRIEDRDHHTFEMWTKGPDGKRFRQMLVEYTRK